MSILFFFQFCVILIERSSNWSAVYTDFELVFQNAGAFKQTLCSSTWVEAKGTFGASLSLHSRILCCKAGSYLLNSNTLGKSSDGSWTVADNNACDTCPAGQYTEELNIKTSCTTCSRNTIAPAKGLTSCADCNTPHFSNGGINCDICGAGTITTIGVTETQCDPCDAGLYQEGVGKSTCNKCLVGWNQKDSGKAFCLPCAPGM